MKVFVSRVGCMPLLCLASLIGTFPRHASVLIRELTARDLVRIPTHRSITPYMEGVASARHTPDVLGKAVQVFKDKSSGRAGPAVMPVLQNDWPFVFERLADYLYILGR